MRKCWFLSILLAPALLCLLLATPARTASSIWRGGADQPPGVGTSQSPYRISTGEHLKWFANEVNSGSGSGHAQLTDDIMLNGISNWENWATTPPANHWTPIGNSSNGFTGVFDGQGYQVIGIYINSTNSYQGLFGYIGHSGQVKNVQVASSYIKGDSYVGGISGYLNFFGEISGCTSGATVVGVGNYTGGVVGSAVTNSQLQHCSNTGGVTGGNCTGGLTGSCNGTVNGVTNTGPVNGGSWVGGLIGLNYATLSNSYNQGDVCASVNYAGGVAGINGTNGAVTSVYTTGLVSGGWPVCDNTVAGSSLSNVYYLGSPQGDGIGSNQGTGIPVNLSAHQFSSGEAAYLLGEAFGQTTGPGGDPLPVFRKADNSNALYRLIYLNGEETHAIQYYNEGAAVSAEDIPEPDMDDDNFLDWEGLPDLMPAEEVTVTANSTPAPPIITTVSPLVDGIAHGAYSVLIQATGTKPITFTLLSGALPAGLTLDEETGAITGAPFTSGSFTITVRAQNSYGHDDKSFALDISDDLPGDGSLNSPYQIWTVDHLLQFADKVNTGDGRFYALLQADISLNDTGDWENWGSCAPANAWTPIGSAERPFKGGFDGNNHSISGVYIQSSADYQGFFGVVSFVTTVKNLNLEQSHISGNEYVGGICGSLSSLSLLDGCRNAATVEGVKYIGGICGDLVAANAQIIDCRNEGVVKGTANVGGICGLNNGSLHRCSNGGAVTGGIDSSGIGGLCGISYSEIAGGYNTAAVSGSNNTGGLCGVISGIVSKEATLNGGYNRGTVTGTCNGGAICGVANAYCRLSGCYYLDSCPAGGIGFNEGAYLTTGKPSAQFAAGEVAYLLGAPFGQTMGLDESPVFRTSDPDNTVYRLLYQNDEEDYAVQYYNEGDAVSAVGAPEPTASGCYFSHWEGLPVLMPADDVTVSAVFAPVPLGDVDGQGQINVGDAILALRHIVGLTELEPWQIAVADVDRNGRIDVGDAILILRYIVGLIDQF